MDEGICPEQIKKEKVKKTSLLIYSATIYS
jgi:hypothetical protein